LSARMKKKEKFRGGGKRRTLRMGLSGEGKKTLQVGEQKRKKPKVSAHPKDIVIIKRKKNDGGEVWPLSKARKKKKRLAQRGDPGKGWNKKKKETGVSRQKKTERPALRGKTTSVSS